MPVRQSNAIWNGTLKDGEGTMRLGSGTWEGSYSFPSRFESGEGTNPEELIAAAHAGCFSMALSAGLTKNGFEPKRVETGAKVHLGKVGDAFAITKIELDTLADVPGIDDDRFQELAAEAKTSCPVSKALAGTEITLNATLTHR